MREQLLIALGTTRIRQARTAIGMAVAAIAKQDWPEQWPQLFQQLVEMVRSGDALAVDGAVLCMALFADYIDDRSVAAVAPAAFPMLMHIIKSPPAQYSPSVRRRVVTIMRCFFEIFTHVRDDPAGEAHKILQAALPEWLNTLPQSFSIQGWMMRNGEDGFGIEISILRIFHIVVRDLYKVFPGLVRTVVEIVWGLCSSCCQCMLRGTVSRTAAAKTFHLYQRCTR